MCKHIIAIGWSLLSQRQCKEIQDGKWSMYKRADRKWTALRAKTQQVAVGRFWTDMCFEDELKGGKADKSGCVTL